MGRVLRLVAAAFACSGVTAFAPRCDCARAAVRLRAAPVGADVEGLKRGLLRRIGRRDPEAEILAAAAALEATGTRSGAVDGTWNLVYSTRASEPSDAGRGPLARVSDGVYSALFRAAPFLAGGGGGGGGPFAVANVQTLDVEGGALENEVRIGTFLTLRVFGSAAVTSDPDALAVAFDGVEINGAVTLPLPRPTGSVVTTFVDGALRLARGSRGGLFVLRRRGAGAGSPSRGG